MQAATATSNGWVEPQKVDYTAFNAETQSNGQFDGEAPIYQWNDDFGDVGPKYEILELELFGDPQSRHDRAGLDFSK